jgi:hypothetical protein
MVQRKLSSLINKIETDLNKVRDEFLNIVAEDLVNTTVQTNTVDTGAYITSHSITTTRGAGRSRTSHNKPRKQDPSVKAAESLAQLQGDIAALPPDQTLVYITNNAPHANNVEYTLGRAIYSSVRNRAAVNLDKAVNIVRGTQ